MELEYLIPIIRLYNPVTECFLNKNQTVQLISDSTGGSVDTEEIVALFSSLLFSDDNERMIWISEICNVSFWERVHRTLTKGLDDEVNRCSSHVVLGIDFLTIIKTIKNISVSEGEKIANNIFVNGLLNDDIFVLNSLLDEEQQSLLSQLRQIIGKERFSPLELFCVYILIKYKQDQIKKCLLSKEKIAPFTSDEIKKSQFDLKEQNRQEWRNLNTPLSESSEIQKSKLGTTNNKKGTMKSDLNYDMVTNLDADERRNESFRIFGKENFDNYSISANSTSLSASFNINPTDYKKRFRKPTLQHDIDPLQDNDIKHLINRLEEISESMSIRESESSCQEVALSQNRFPSKDNAQLEKIDSNIDQLKEIAKSLNQKTTQTQNYSSLAYTPSPFSHQKWAKNESRGNIQGQNASLFDEKNKPFLVSEDETEQYEKEELQKRSPRLLNEVNDTLSQLTTLSEMLHREQKAKSTIRMASKARIGTAILQSDKLIQYYKNGIEIFKADTQKLSDCERNILETKKKIEDKKKSINEYEKECQLIEKKFNTSSVKQ